MYIILFEYGFKGLYKNPRIWIRLEAMFAAYSVSNGSCINEYCLKMMYFIFLYNLKANIGQTEVIFGNLSLGDVV